MAETSENTRSAYANTWEARTRCNPCSRPQRIWPTLLDGEDPIATVLLKKYNVRIPNTYVADVDASYIIRYIEEQSAGARETGKQWRRNKSCGPIVGATPRAIICATRDKTL